MAFFRNLFFLAVGILLLWLTFKDQDFMAVWQKVKAADPFYILLCCVFSVLALLSRSRRWVQLIEPLGYRPRLSSTFHSIMFGYLANMAIPRLGEISRCGALSKSDQVPFEKLVGTVIAERLLDVVMLALCIVVTAALEFEVLGGFLMREIFNPIIHKLGNAGVFLGVAAGAGAIGVSLAYKLFKHPHPPAFVHKLKGLSRGIGEGLQSITRIRNKGEFIFHTIFIWSMYFGMSYVCFFALPETETLGPAAGLFIMVLGGIGMTAPVQGGIGAYHLLVSKGMLLYGLSETDGLVYATMSHAVSTLLLILLGGASMLQLFFFIRTKPSATA